MTRVHGLAASALLCLLFSSTDAKAQCPASLDNSIYAPATDLARSWSVLDILLSSDDGKPPSQWLPHEIVPASGPPIANPGEDDPALSSNGATPEERWETSYKEAIARFHAHAMACTPDEFVGVPGLATGWNSDAFGDPTALEALEDYAQVVKPRSILLSRSVGHLGGLPAVRPIVLALSQTVTRGQPGFAPSLSLSPFTDSEGWFARHLVFSLSGLIINPDTASEAGGEITPVVASVEGYVGTSSEARVDDWYLDVIRHSTENIDALNELRKNKLRRMVEDYRKAAPGNNTSKQKEAFLAVRNAAARNFRDDVFTYYKNRYIFPLETKKSTFDWSLAIRARYTNDATWVAEVADLVAVGLEGAFEYQFADVDGFKFSLTGGLLGSASGYSTALGWLRTDTPPEGVDTPGWGALADANMGLTLFVPAESEGSVVSAARVSLSGLARGQLREEASSLRFGFSATLEIPVSERVSLAGSYTLRCLGGGTCVSSSGLTFAVAGLNR